MLRLYIKSLLLEAMTSPHAVSETYAIWSDYYHDAGVPPAGAELNFAMYDLESAKAFIKEGMSPFHSQEAYAEGRNTNPSKVFIERCNYFKENPPEPNWDGVWKMTTK